MRRSKRSAHRCLSLRASISCAVTRTRSPSLRTLPSSDVAAGEFARDRARIGVAALVGEGRLPRGDVQALGLQSGRQVLDQAIGEMREAPPRPTCSRTAARRGPPRRASAPGQARASLPGVRRARALAPEPRPAAYDVEGPAEQQRDWKAEQQQYRRERDRPRRQPQRREHGVRDLHEQPAHDHVGRGDPEDPALAEFVQQAPSAGV